MDTTRRRLADALKALRDTASHRDINALPEAATRSQLIEPLLAGMGFAGLDDMEWEHHVKASGQRIDYVLKVSGERTVAVEAKSFGTDLTDSHAAQVVQYAAIEGIEWCLLTNGRQMWVYNAELKGDLAAKRIVGIDLLGDEADEVIDVLHLLNKDGLGQPEKLREWVRGVLLDRALRLTLLDHQSPAIQGLADVARSATGMDVEPNDVSAWFARIFGQAESPQAPVVIGQPLASKDSPAAQAYWLLPAGSAPDGASSTESLHRWLDKGMWGMGRSTGGRKRMKEGDRVCFYAAGVGVVARAELAGSTDGLVTSEDYPEPTAMEEEVFKIPLRDVQWLPQAVVLDDAFRSRLDAFQDKRQSSIWSWFVQTTSKLTERDFRLLVGDSQGD